MSFKQFIEDINHRIGVQLPTGWCELSEVDLSQKFLTKLNAYFYQTYEGIGNTEFQNSEIQYFSEFHKFWEEHHKEILGAHINNAQAAIAAECLPESGFFFQQFKNKSLITHRKHTKKKQKK